MQSSSDLTFPHTTFEDCNMEIVLQNAGKRFNRDWIFRRVNFTFQQGRSYAITGPNGSGKSTLLQTIAGAISPSEGIVEYAEKRIGNLEFGIREQTHPAAATTENFFNYIAIVA